MPAWCSVEDPDTEHDFCPKSGIFDFGDLREEVRAAMEQEVEEEQRDNEGAEEFDEDIDPN